MNVPIAICRPQEDSDQQQVDTGKQVMGGILSWHWSGLRSGFAMHQQDSRHSCPRRICESRSEGKCWAGRKGAHAKEV